MARVKPQQRARLHQLQPFPSELSPHHTFRIFDVMMLDVYVSGAPGSIKRQLFCMVPRTRQPRRLLVEKSSLVICYV